jgi:hypothetical protein
MVPVPQHGKLGKALKPLSDAGANRRQAFATHVPRWSRTEQRGAPLFRHKPRGIGG